MLAQNVPANAFAVDFLLRQSFFVVVIVVFVFQFTRTNLRARVYAYEFMGTNLRYGRRRNVFPISFWPQDVLYEVLLRVQAYHQTSK